MGWCCLQELADRARISYTVYMRTTQEQHKKAVEHVWVRLLYSFTCRSLS